MKTILSVSAVLFLGLVGVALAGAGPETAAPAGCHGRVAAGCHGQPMALVEQGCHGATMLAPAVAPAGCHGDRLTFAERRTARSAARQNFRTTLHQFKAAGREGTVSAVPAAELPTYEYVPAN